LPDRLTKAEKAKVVEAIGEGATLAEACGVARVELNVVLAEFTDGRRDRGRGAKTTPAAKFHSDVWHARGLWRMELRAAAVASAQNGQRVSAEFQKLLDRPDSDLDIEDQTPTDLDLTLESIRSVFDAKRREDPEFRAAANRYLEAANALLGQLAGRS
jgi:hypothetical protein